MPRNPANLPFLTLRLPPYRMPHSPSSSSSSSKNRAHLPSSINAHIARYLRNPTPTWLAVQKAVAAGMKHLVYYYEPLDHYIHFAQTGLPVHDQHVFDEKAGFFFSGVEDREGDDGGGGGGEDGKGRKRKFAPDDKEEERDGLSSNTKGRKLEGKNDEGENEDESEQPRIETEINAGNAARAGESKGNTDADAKKKEAGRNIKSDQVDTGAVAARGADSAIGKSSFWTKHDYEDDLYTPFGRVEQCDRTGSKSKACERKDSTLMAALDTGGEEDKDMDIVDMNHGWQDEWDAFFESSGGGEMSRW